MTAEEKKRRFWKRVIILAIAWIFVVPLIAFVVFGVIGLRAANAPVASQPHVPNLKGLQIETAQKTSHQAGFLVEVAGKDIDSNEKPGTVVNQEPWAGSSDPSRDPSSVLCKRSSLVFGSLPFHLNLLDPSSVLCKRSSLVFGSLPFHLNLLAAVGAVGTVGKRSLFFHGFHSPVFRLADS